MKLWPLLTALVILLAAIGATALVSARLDGGNFVYPLDDTYIHMAMARTFSQHGVWGISPDGFASTSSSPLWTLVLSLAFLVFGPAAAAPLVLNVVLPPASFAWYISWPGAPASRMGGSSSPSSPSSCSRRSFRSSSAASSTSSTPD